MLLRMRQKREAATARVVRRRADEKGFTLLEIIIALLVMMISVLGTASLFIFAINYNSGSRDRTVALAIAQQRIERLRNIPFTDAALNATAAAGTTETLQTNNRTFAVTTVITDVPGSPPAPTTEARRKVITVTVRPLGGRTVTRNGQQIMEWSFSPVTLSTTRSTLKVGQYTM